ncbi:MAG TPA: DUF542 domain-containing protein, partial [Thermoanaerobaculia bacterium]|nr:DUF542 domain-containing protein [Thermoanaerobaculia bacterium]
GRAPVSPPHLILCRGPYDIRHGAERIGIGNCDLEITVMSARIDRTMTIGAIVKVLDGARGVFEKWNLDYFCHGDATLAEACAEVGVGVDEIWEDLLAITRGESISALPAGSGGHRSGECVMIEDAVARLTMEDLEQ